MFKALSIQDCKNMLQYYKIERQSCIKKMKYKAVDLLIHRMCKCYSTDTTLQYIIHKRYYNSRNYKNLNTTKRNKQFITCF